MKIDKKIVMLVISSVVHLLGVLGYLPTAGVGDVACPPAVVDTSQ